MSYLPEFFQVHALTDDADERAVKRAYAKALKQIDQESDLEGFQRLREMYERALVWLQYKKRDSKAHVIADAVADANKKESDEAESKSTTYLEDLQKTPNPSFDHPSTHAENLVGSATDSLAQLGDPVATAQQVFKELLQALRLHEESGAYAKERLAQALDDELMINMETRLVFEQVVVHYLAQGWQPGNGELFDMAADAFAWKSDGRRLLNWGRDGYILERALIEQAAFEKNSKNIRDAHWALLLKARKEPDPDRYYLEVNFPKLQRLLGLYPNWVMLVSSKKNIEHWRKKFVSTQLDLSQDECQQGEVVEYSVESNNSSEGKWIIGVIALFALVLLLCGIPSKDKPEYHDLNRTGEVPSTKMLTAQELYVAGEHYFSGHSGNSLNVDEAIHYWTLASEKGSADASYQLAWIYDTGNHVEKNPAEANKWYEKAAGQGHLRSQITLAKYFYSDADGKKDLKKAFHYYEMAAKQGHAFAQLQLAYMYDRGLGVERNTEKTLYWGRAAAENKNASAEAILGNFYLTGTYGLSKDEEKAAYWLTRSAAQHDPVGERLLASMYERGLNKYPVDLDKAAVLYSQSAAQGDQQAQEKLKIICKKKKYPSCPAS